MRDFQTLFKGREDAHGHYFSTKGAKATDRGKLVSKAESLAEPVTPELWKNHISGDDRLGIIPVRKDGRVNWFVIDIDFYKIGKKKLSEVGGYEKLCAAIEAHGMKLVVTRSKSGGAHMWGFLEEPIKAKEASDAAKHLLGKLDPAALLGIDPSEFKQHVDIFPKDFSPDNIGSWVNIPYFGKACGCVGQDGMQDLSLHAFVKLANERLYNPDELKFKAQKEAPAKKGGKHGDMPPCLEFMLKEGVPEGHRNDCVTQFAIYALKAHHDDFDEKVREFNDTACQPPLRNDELAPILKSVQAKGYEGYLCNKIKDIYCDKEACKKRTFGIGRGDVSDVGITRLEKIDGEEPLYIVTIGEKHFTVGVVDLFLYANFRRKAMAAINRLLPALRQPEWEDLLSIQLEMMEITEAASDTQMRDRVIKQFQQWCSQSCISDSLEAAYEANAPFYDGKVIIFSGDAFLSGIDRQLRIERDQAYVYLRNWGTTVIEKDVKGKKTKLWCYVPRGPLWFDPMKGRQA
jgi:hypothetical protein